MSLEKSDNLFPENKIEKDTPAIKYRIIRHVERTASGQLTEDGINDARRKGQNLHETTEVIKGYSSQENSDRAYKTVKTISETSKIQSPLTGKVYETRRRPGLFYDLSGPLTPRIEEYTKMVNAAVEKDYPDFDPLSDNPKWPKIRKEYQSLVMKKMVADDPEISHIMSMGVAHELHEIMNIGGRYVKSRNPKTVDDKDISLKKDLILIAGTHGGFPEALLKKALVRIDSEGKEKFGFSTYRDKEGNPEFEEAVGGIFKPGESFDIVEKIGQEKQARLPIEFENIARFPAEKCFLDLEKVKDLSDQFDVYFKKFQAWQADNSQAEELLSLLNNLKTSFSQKYEKYEK